MAFHVFFEMSHIALDRENSQKELDNLFASGDLSLSLGFFLAGLFLLLAIVSLIYLVVSRPLSIIPSLLYIPCIYLLVHKKIKKWQVPSVFRYILLAAVCVATRGYYCFILMNLERITYEIIGEPDCIFYFSIIFGAS